MFGENKARIATLQQGQTASAASVAAALRQTAELGELVSALTSNAARADSVLEQTIQGQIDGLSLSLREISRMQGDQAAEAREAIDAARSAAVQAIKRAKAELWSAYNLDFKMITPAAENLSIGGLGLNTAAADSVVVWFAVPLVNAAEDIWHDGYENAGATSIASVFADAAPPSDPTLKRFIGTDPFTAEVDYGAGAPAWEDGVFPVAVILDTDTNPATKVYTIGDTIDITCKVSSGSSIHGQAVADVVKAYTLVA